LNTSNILVKRITDEVKYTSNYVERLTTGLGANYWTEESTNNIYLNKSGNVGIGTQTSLTNKLQVQGNMSVSGTCAITGRVGIGVATIGTTHDLDVLGSGRISGGIITNTILAVGLITGNAGLTIPSGQTLTSLGTLTASVINASGLITGNAGLTIPAGQTLTSSGTLTASVINASGLITGNAGLTIPSGQTLTSSGTLTASVINASGLITGNAGLTIPAGQTLTSSGTLTASVINASGLITATNATAGTTDSLIMRYNTTNSLRFQQRYIGVDDVRYDLIQKVANVDKISCLTFYNGNVGIGTNEPTNILEIGVKDPVLYPVGKTFTLAVTGSAYINNTIYFSKAYYGSFGNYPCNKLNFYPIAGYGNGMGSGNGTMDYFTGGPYGSGSHIFFTNATDTSFGTERMRITGSGVGIGNTNPQGRLHIGTDALNQGFGEILIGCNNGSGSRTTKMGWDSEFYYNLCGDYTGGGQNTWTTKQIRCYWTAPTNSLYIAGNGNVNMPNGITAGNYNGGYIVSNSYILSYDAVYARSSYDTKIRSDSTGMFLEMGDIGNNNYLRIGAYGGTTNIDSGASRSIYFRSSTSSWLFGASGTSYNAGNSSFWNVVSDHRIKENIKKANLKTCYDNVKNINLYRFNYIDGVSEGVKHDRTQLGFIAQQVKQYYPKSVKQDKIRLDDKREIPDLLNVDVNQVNYT
jgi:hypothetical protein